MVSTFERMKKKHSELSKTLDLDDGINGPSELFDSYNECNKKFCSPNGAINLYPLLVVCKKI
jgi:hypothetical protein